LSDPVFSRGPAAPGYLQRKTQHGVSSPSIESSHSIYTLLGAEGMFSYISIYGLTEVAFLSGQLLAHGHLAVPGLGALRHIWKPPKLEADTRVGCPSIYQPLTAPVTCPGDKCHRALL
jgi:hypothetical protein